MKYDIDKELKSIVGYKGSTVIHLYPMVNMVYKAYKCRSDENVVVNKYMISGFKGAKLPVVVIEPRNCGDILPCLFLFHGGGFVMKASKAHYQIAKKYAKMGNCKVIIPDYSLLPKYRFPVAIEDCYNTYMWAIDNAEKLRIDINKIILAGDSAGGNIAAAVVLMLRERNLNIPKGLLMVYPVLDKRMGTESMKKFTDTPIWDAKCEKIFWDMYYQDLNEWPEYFASPMEAPSLEFFPPTYIEVAEYDCLHDEGVLFAERLRKEGVAVELHEVKGACHGYEAVTESSVVTKSVTQRIKWIIDKT